MFTCLKASLAAVLPATVEIVQAQDNRVPEPQGSDFIVMTPMRRDRLETNVDTPFDCLFTASINAGLAGGTMTVTALTFGTITLGNQVFGTGVAANTLIVNQLSGSVGGTGVYAVSIKQTIPSQSLASGVNNLLQPTQFMVQLDVHGPNSGDNVQVISTIFRDQYGYDLFTAQCLLLGLFEGAVVPFYADDPNQMPFINDQDQYEQRWVIQAFMQANMSLTVPQQFAGTVTPTETSVEASFPS